MTLYGFVLRARTGTLFRVVSEGRRVLFDGSFSTCAKEDLLDHLLGEWSSLTHRSVLRFAPGCSNGVAYIEVTI